MIVLPAPAIASLLGGTYLSAGFRDLDTLLGGISKGMI
jgi:hypothetical protein